jgi:tRNA modification GTPase
MFLNDTIAAIATPIGEGGIGIVRISGLQAKDIGLSLLKKSNQRLFTELEDHRLYHGFVTDPQTGANIDEVLFFYIRKPHSFTAEDTVEIQAHGGILNLTKILELVLKQGARMAEPGEFTLRAYLNGRIDLVQAESIIDLIRAKTDKAHKLAMKQLTGKTTEQIQKSETDLYQILISIEAILDFPEEGLPELTKNSIKASVVSAGKGLKDLLSSINEGRKIREGISIVIVGRPNVGKSSLLNCFLQEERAIVTEIPGTTRDIIEAQFQLQGIPIRLYDTAGLHFTENPIERIGIQKTEQYIDEADVILFILDGNDPFTDEDKAIINKIEAKTRTRARIIVVINKTDLPQRLDTKKIPRLSNAKYVELSALTGTGFSDLEKAIINTVGLGEIHVDDRPLLSRVRHKKALEQAIESLDHFINGLDQGISEDLLAVDLRSCLAAIGEITGKNVSEEVLRGIFSQFCIGK